MQENSPPFAGSPSTPYQHPYVITHHNGNINTCQSTIFVYYLCVSSVVSSMQMLTHGTCKTTPSGTGDFCEWEISPDSDGSAQVPSLQAQKRISDMTGLITGKLGSQGTLHFNLTAGSIVFSFVVSFVCNKALQNSVIMMYPWITSKILLNLFSR